MGNSDHGTTYTYTAEPKGNPKVRGFSGLIYRLSVGRTVRIAVGMTCLPKVLCLLLCGQQEEEVASAGMPVRAAKGDFFFFFFVTRKPRIE